MLDSYECFTYNFGKILIHLDMLAYLAFSRINHFEWQKI
ncbi:hypothetical protein D1BOALGB6SA_4384 [Olavius sp. associated proteobacterium Delta 1]|nr:hypothetical protein D1BOALGB6SA_4384 [Olavius sp. associated proteobacterium Delta 1]